MLVDIRLLFSIISNALILMKESRNHGLVLKNGKTKQQMMLSFRMDLAKDLKKRKVTDVVLDLKPENGHWP